MPPIATMIASSSLAFHPITSSFPSPSNSLRGVPLLRSSKTNLFAPMRMPRSTVRCAVIEKETPESERPSTFLREADEANGSSSASSVRARFEKMIREAQDTVCAAIEEADKGGKFKEDVWSRPGGGGGISRVLQDGDIWEKAGVNVSVVYGMMPPEAYRAAKAAASDQKAGPIPFFAAGISSVSNHFFNFFKL